ncbi:hypothetical protein Nans01_44870 [Nocardiopsis ansamitocini]|uniref:DUF5753 domain-containing protein n=1 Tax=Nocardiopsis ansamitocini TaxID=1670832 RepID=A0A9W6PAU5_9ACTN|nr:hypothetical protein Nans01_44870 [Nocardiopsis ansamitocini]
MVPPHGFTIYDDTAVSVETFTAELTITEPDAVADYRAAYEAIEPSALTGDDARALLREIRDDFRKLTTVIQ